jgi:hypothetical protein
MPVTWSIEVAKDGRVEISNLSGNIIESILAVQNYIGAASINMNPIEYKQSLARILAQIVFGWYQNLYSAGNLNIRSTSELTGLFESKIDSLMSVAASGHLPIKWKGTDGIELLGHVPISWAAHMAESQQTSFGTAHYIKIHEGRLLVDYGEQTMVSQSMPTDYFRIVNSIGKFVGGWLQEIDAYGKLDIQYASTATTHEAMLSLGIEYKSGRRTKTAVPIRELMEISARYNIPIDIIGVLVGIITQIKAQVILPGYLEAQVLNPKIVAALAIQAGITGAQIREAELKRVVEIITKVMAQKTGGGE